jgi:hypothetical protein
MECPHGFELDRSGAPLHPVQIEGLRRMSPGRKIELVCELYRTGVRLRVAGLRLRHPDWTDAQLEFEARRALRHAGT